jgi:hypothetical protein
VFNVDLAGELLALRLALITALRSELKEPSYNEKRNYEQP